MNQPRPVGDLVQRDHHDLGRQDQVGADRAGDHGALGVRPVLGHRVIVVVVAAQPAPDLLGALEAEVAAADHQDRRQQARDELAEQQRHREDDQQLVAQ